MTLLPKVLVVDDDKFIRTALTSVFEAADIAVQTFATAGDLLSCADLDSPAVLILDVRLPNMSGPELQALLLERGVTLPIVFLTGSADIPVAVTAMRNGAVDFLEKPFKSAALVDRIRQIFERLADPDGQLSPPPALEYLARLATLTPRERDVYEGIIKGHSSKLIARSLGCSFRTVEIHRSRVMSKMRAGSLAGLLREAFAPGSDQ